MAAGAQLSRKLFTANNKDSSSCPRKLWTLLCRRSSVLVLFVLGLLILPYTEMNYTYLGEVEISTVREFDAATQCYFANGRAAIKEGGKDRVIKPDKLTLGPCRFDYPSRFPPNKGYLHEIDFFHFRDMHKTREQCFLHCIDQLDERELNDSLLVDAATMGLTEVAKKLKTKHNLDPLYSPSLGPKFDNKPSFNAIQEAIRGGYADMVKLLSDSDNNMVIDNLGRTVSDYIRTKGSAIRPKDAANILSLDMKATGRKLESTQQGRAIGDLGWNQQTSFDIDDRCDIDVVYDNMSRETFYNDYFTTGRPFVLRNAVPRDEILAFSKRRWANTSRFHPNTLVTVGPTANPIATGQEYCEKSMSILEIENATECKEMPGVPMVHVWHPLRDDWDELYPMYNGDVYDKKGGWRMIEDWFGAEPWEYKFSWPAFFGGDGSGATLHWHNAALNILYVGIKEWRMTPPKYRGFTGMPARAAASQLDDSFSLRCTQYPGDMIYIPDYWGHLTMNHGFTIGAAAIVPSNFQKTADAQPRIFFVHINKTGGTSMIRMLQNRCRSHFTMEHWGKGHRTFHATAHSFIDHHGRDVWNNAFSFVVVRHPLARLVSNFFFLLEQCKDVQKRRGFCKKRHIPTELDIMSLTDEQKIEAFHQYISELYSAYPPGSPNHYLFGSRGHGNEEFKTFNATQTSWIVDENNNIAVKNIFHLETLSEDMSKLADMLPCLKSEDGLEMEHTNASPKYPDYKLFGSNERTNQIVKEVFAVDFKNFEYEQ